METGQEIWEAACAGCHGMDGRGQPVSTLGFEPPATFPDFTDCNGSTRESTLQWSSVIHDGGRARAFVEIMPSFGPPENPALNDDQIRKVIAYARTFCTESDGWASGDFNIPRPMFTEKAFPEDEVVQFNTINTDGSGFGNHLIVEKRFGSKTNLETRVRGLFKQTPAGSWTGSYGDMSFELKRSMYINNRTGSLLAWANEFIVPSGNAALGLGNGIFKYESFLSFAQLFPKLSYFNGQIGIETPPFHRHQSLSEFYFRTVMGKVVTEDRGFGRAWGPAVEFVGIRKLGPYQNWTLDFVPQLQVTLSKRQHMRLGVGVSIPTVNKQMRTTQAMFYILWDTFDGGMFEGWR